MRFLIGSLYTIASCGFVVVVLVLDIYKIIFGMVFCFCNYCFGYLQDTFLLGIDKIIFDWCFISGKRNLPYGSGSAPYEGPCIGVGA